MPLGMPTADILARCEPRPGPTDPISREVRHPISGVLEDQLLARAAEVGGAR